MRALMCAFLVVAMVVTGCGDDDDDATTPTTASDDVATTVSADFEVLFDGEACTATGPESVPAGEYTFVLTDTSDRGVEVDVAGYADGYTYADWEEYIEEAGGEGTQTSPPDWARRDAGPSVMRDFEAPPLDLAENQTQYDFVLESGSYGIAVHRDGDWGCAGFEVT